MRPVDTDPAAEGADAKEILEKTAWYVMHHF
jgi:hypothetical protein